MRSLRADARRPEPRVTPALFAVIGAAALAAVLLGLQLPQDPVPGFTFSDSPFTDEGWSVLGARNQALLGTWSTDEWELFWAQLPFNVAALAAFELGGVGIIQARLVAVVSSVLAVGLLAELLARRVGIGPALVGAAGLGTSTLLLYYGRLALLEPMVLLFLVLGFSLLLGGRPVRPLAGGIAAGSALALAIATKPSAGFAVAGMLVAALLAGGGAVDGLRRRIGLAAAVIGASGFAWLAVVLAQPGLLPSILRIWPQQEMPSSVPELIERAGTYVMNSDGALGAAAPLLIGGAIGLVIGVAGWRRLEPSRRVVLAAATGWFLAGLLVLVVVPYRPNRYVLPLLPALAILTALGVEMVGGRIGGVGRRVRLAAVTALIVAVSAPGVVAVGTWATAATYRLPAIQARMLELIADPAPMEGGPAATMAMRVPAPAITARSFVNAGDLYDEYGVRWLLIGRTMAPAWAGDHAEAWAAREVVECFDWPSGEACLIRVP